MNVSNALTRARKGAFWRLLARRRIQGKADLNMHSAVLAIVAVIHACMLAPVVEELMQIFNQRNGTVFAAGAPDADDELRFPLAVVMGEEK